MNMLSNLAELGLICGAFLGVACAFLTIAWDCIKKELRFYGWIS